MFLIPLNFGERERGEINSCLVDWVNDELRVRNIPAQHSRSPQLVQYLYFPSFHSLISLPWPGCPKNQGKGDKKKKLDKNVKPYEMIIYLRKLLASF